MISGYGCYLKYLAIKAHFQTDKYDYIKYHGVVKAKETSFQVRNDRFFFEKLAKKLKEPEEVEKFFVANFVQNSTKWIGEYVENGSFEVYTRWKATMESISYVLETDLNKLMDVFGAQYFADVFKPANGDYSECFKMLRRGDIRIESVILLNSLLFNFIEAYWDTGIKDRIVYPNFRRSIVKYGIFLNSYLTVEQKKKLKEKISTKLLDNL